MDEKDKKLERIFEERNPLGRRRVKYEPDRPKTLAEYETKYPVVGCGKVLLHFRNFKAGRHTVNQIANWHDYDVPDFKRGTLEETTSSKSPRSHIRNRLEQLLGMGFLEKFDAPRPVTYSLTLSGQKELEAIEKAGTAS